LLHGTENISKEVGLLRACCCDKYAHKCRPFFMEKIILPVASEEGGETIVPIVEQGDKIIVVVGPGTRLLHRPISNVNPLEIYK
jgi:hypothetical protein